jgi:transcriptional regulator with XRE-family HTH domain
VTVQDSVVTDVAQAVAGRVRALRQARGWSLDELAGRSGVSKGMVVQIENARTNPSIGTLCRIADAYGVSVPRLLEPLSDRRVDVRDAADAVHVWSGANGGFARILAHVTGRDFAEFWEWVLAPGDGHTSPEHPPGTREFLHILEGVATVTADGQDFEVAAGQTIDYVADKPHGYRNDGAVTARLLMVTFQPALEWDRRTD